MAILLLDFEKAYGRVDWGFLGETMLWMGFPNSWIRGIAAMYRIAHSQMLLARDWDNRFSISRSVHQGCPASSAAPIKLSLTNEERAGLAAKVERLQLHSVIGKVVGSRPSRNELRDQL